MSANPAPMPEIAYRPYALRLMLSLLVALAVVVIHSSIGEGRRAQLETSSEATAVGDKEFYPRGADAPPLLFGGQPLVLVNPHSFEPRETKMRHVGEDDSHRFRLYVYTGHEPLETFE